ncbi:MAG: hypothetical protein IT365_13890 [Candidatus Hydrogenedentes bacterium]|nr:hypothetical protein [Candidatus Hydrogenedentota bacterium]
MGNLDRAAEMRRHEPLLARLAASRTELVIVVGPREDRTDTAHWTGAVLSVNGQVKGLPTLEQAIHDGLFAPGTGRYLAAFDPKRISKERAAEAKARTEYAIKAMQSRARGEVPPAFVSPTLRPSEAEVASRRAQAFGKNTRLKFERVYAAAQKAIEASDVKTALIKCRAALELLREENIYGAQQVQLEEALRNEIDRLQTEPPPTAQAE